VDGILITEPVTALDGVVSVPSPVVLVHVAERCVDSSLCGDSVRSGGEQLGNTGGFETLLDQTECCSKASTSSTNYDCVKGMIDYRIFLEKSILALKYFLPHHP
jgi:hypothetical protein